MTLHYKFDVIIIGAGPAGVTAAGTLAGTGLSVALLESGIYAGAENWSGCVYFAESLAAADCFGPDAVAAAPYERTVLRRGTLLHNGLDVVGLDLSDSDSFRNCYTVLRPVYDPYFAELARRKGVAHITGTTVTALIRNTNKVIGVETNRGPLYADVTFIAEGDASHLVRAEQMERVAQPHFLQGVKAVLSLLPEQIEQRFKLKPGQGAAYELLIRNPALGGRTAKLNIGAFLYTNRNSLSLGYVAPLDNVRDSFRGRHDTVYEWLRGLPYIRELTEGAALSAYGTKIIRSGGWHERPVLVENGLAVGGASVGFGIDIPVPNFTGPASATGLYFGRAVKQIVKRGGSFDAKQLTREYLEPLRESVYGRNARYLSHWPGYFGRSKVLFGRTVDVACGTAHFLSTRSLADAGRFLRPHILSVRGIRELLGDTLHALRSLGLRKKFVTSLLNPLTIGWWFANQFRPAPPRDGSLGIILYLNGKQVDAASLPWPANSLITRLSPSLLAALRDVYRNDSEELRGKFSDALARTLRGLRLTDIVVLPLFGGALFLAAVGTALYDAFRFYVLKTPVQKLLAEPVMTYTEAQKNVRDLDCVKPGMSLEAKLATNTYRVGQESHIRTLWPGAIADEPEMAKNGLWSVCPARVYVYDAPAFGGRGRVTVNYENCIKCESCWRAEPLRTLWGRHTGHKLIYRPETAALSTLMDVFKKQHSDSRPKLPEIMEQKLWYLRPSLLNSASAVQNAATAFRKSVVGLPASADHTRKAWPISLGKRLVQRLKALETALDNDSRPDQAEIIQEECRALEQRLSEDRLFHALYCSHRIEERVRTWTEPERKGQESEFRNGDLSSLEASSLFPDRVVKQWEDSPIPEEWRTKLHAFISGHQETPSAVVRALSSVNPALGLIAAHHLQASRILKAQGIEAADVCAVQDSRVEITESGSGAHLKGLLQLVPAAAAQSILLCTANKAFLVPLSTKDLTITATGTIGFRAARFVEISLDCSVPADNCFTIEAQPAVPDAGFYLAIALGAADYLSKRVMDHAEARVQFGGQMLDTEGRDGIAKLGAVKALVARTGAWRLLLESLYQSAGHADLRTPNSERGLLFSTIAAKAFGPEPGSMGYDAGQVFGGFAYSEDDLLSRFYRDSSIFRFLRPGYGAAARLNQIVTRIDTRGLDSVAEEPFGTIASRLKATTQRSVALSATCSPHLSGETKSLAIALRDLLLEMEASLNRGEGNEAGAGALGVLLGLTEDAMSKAAISAGSGKVSPIAVFPVEPSDGKPTAGTDYEAFCSAPGARHQSGTFLVTVFDRSPRFVPEMQLDDPKLMTRWADLVEWFKKNCSGKEFSGLNIERYIEQIHRLPDEIVQAAKEHKWLATYIPRSLDGLGWHKAEYYILNSAAGSFGDASIDLLIMASTSIGTTPMLLGLEEELSRVREELEPLVRDPARLGEIKSRLSRIIGTLSSPNPAWIKKEYESVMNLVEERVRRTRVVKYLAANFLKAFYAAGIAGSRGDFNGFIGNLKRSGELLDRLMPDVRSSVDELPRRERCHQLFLRQLGHGAVSAFALTEPTAGSDSGGVKTTAKLQSAPVRQLDDGRYSFHVGDAEEKNMRYLIDADRIVFTESGISYRTPDGTPQTIRFDKYDYKTDQGLRYYRYRGEDLPFHDIGQVRKIDSGFLYEYYSLTGAKMWITNGSIATQFCLYAQTTEGVTGFMVDRHAEGLKVGADEKKTGQRGSPTNEISIDSVRVPREAVIGYEGHGQVNALETLNVGRCGLAVVSGALMRKLMREASALIPPSKDRDALLGEAAAILFGSESLAYYLVGLFDRPHDSVRMESAIAKYVCSEDIHELITLVEEAFGPEGQTEKFLLEKARRDSRILTIYEGTNEVQRFLILKDLIAQAEAWPELVPRGNEADRQLAHWKNKLRAYVRDVAGLLRDTAWSDAMLQPALFPLSEIAGEILRLECISYRLETIEQRSGRSKEAQEYGALMLAAGRRAAERTFLRLAHLEEKFGKGWERIKINMTMPEVQAADAALDARSRHSFAPVKTNTLIAPVRVLAVIRAVADLSPRPRLSEGALDELLWRVDPADQAGLTQILQLGEQTGSRIVLDVLMPGKQEQERFLRDAAGGRVRRLIRLGVDPGAGADTLAKAIRELEALQHYDLILIGAECRNGDRSIGAYLAGSLRKNHYRRARLEVNGDGSGLMHIALPAVVSITESESAQMNDMAAAVASCFTEVRVLPGTGSPESARFDSPPASDTALPTITSSRDAAVYLKAFAASVSAAAASDYTGALSQKELPAQQAVWAILDPQEPRSNLAVVRGAARTALLRAVPCIAAIPAPRPHWPKLLGLAKENGCEQAYCIDTLEGRLSNEGKQSLIRAIMKSSSSILMGSTEWTSSFGFAAGELANGAQKILFCSSVTNIAADRSRTVFWSPVYEGKLSRIFELRDGSAFITTAAEAEFSPLSPSPAFRAYALDFAVAPDSVMALAPIVPLTLSRADVIIDLGYGIKDASGLRLAETLKGKLESLGLQPLFGATRKVTQDLKLLPLDAQIGQTGVGVNPKLIIALGISGAPQHIDYIGTRAEILCFNKDNEAPLMKLNLSRETPRVHPILGDLFVTVRELLEMLG